MTILLSLVTPSPAGYLIANFSVISANDIQVHYQYHGADDNVVSDPTLVASILAAG